MGRDRCSGYLLQALSLERLRQNRSVQSGCSDRQLQMDVAMKCISRHPEDARSLRRWLRSRFICLLSLPALLVLLRMPLTPPREQQARADLSERREDLRPGDRSLGWDDSSLPPETEVIYLQTRKANPVPPQGWRRTDRGWEHVSTWRKLGRPLAEIVMDQQEREPGWVKSGLASIRELPPLAFAMLQVTAISAIFWLSQRDRRRSSDADSKPTRSS